MPLAAPSTLRQCSVCSGAPKPSCYRKGHINLCPKCKNMFSGNLQECSHCYPQTDTLRPTMVIKNSEAPAPTATRLTVTAKMVYADGPDRTMKLEEVKAQAEAAEPSNSEQETDEESCVVNEEQQVSLTEDEPAGDDSESTDDEPGVVTPVEMTIAKVDSAEIACAELPSPEEVPAEDVPAETTPAQKSFQEKLAQLSLGISVREADSSDNNKQVEVIPDTPENAILQIENEIKELSKPRQEPEIVAKKPAQSSALPVKNGKFVKRAEPQRSQTPEAPSCRRCSIHGNPAHQTPEKKADAHRPSLAKNKSVRGHSQVKEKVEETSEGLGECF